MFRSLVRLAAVALILLAAFPAMAAEGRTPIFAPGTVVGPAPPAAGKYVVTTDITNPACAGAALLEITRADADVDLNGFTLDNSGCGTPVILVSAPAADHIRIHNGTLVGGTAAIDIPGGPRKIVLEDIKAHDSTGAGASPAAVNLGGAASAVVRRMEITDAGGTGILWTGPGPLKSGTIEDNVIRGTFTGINVLVCSSVAILNNRIEGVFGPAGFGFGILLESCDGSLVAENTIEQVGAAGIFIVAPPPPALNQPCRASGNKLFDNVVHQTTTHGIHLSNGACDTLVLNNVVSQAGLGGGFGSGLLVEGSRNLIHGNVLNFNNTHGLNYNVPPGPVLACGNAHGRNVAKGNFGLASPGCVAGAGAGAALPVPDGCNNVPAGCPAAPPGGPNVSTLNNYMMALVF